MTTPKDQRQVGIEAIKDEIRAKAKDVPLADIRVSDPEFMQGPPVEQPINAYVRGHATAALFGLSGDSMIDWVAAKVPVLQKEIPAVRAG